MKYLIVFKYVFLFDILKFLAVQAQDQAEEPVIIED